MKPLRTFSLLVFAVAAFFPFSSISAEKNLAYNDAYIWQLADRLATTYAMRHGFSQLSSENQGQFLFEVALEYHHRMIACDGPLPKIAQHLKFALVPLEPEPPPFERMLHVIGSTDYDVWPIILEWALKIENDVTGKLVAMTISTNFPSCLVPGYEMPPISK